MLRELPHDASHYTQGLVLHEGRVIESAGGYGRSALYDKTLAEARVLREMRNARAVFAEGVTIFGSEIFQLTWREGIALVLDSRFNVMREMRYDGEGWGITHDGAALITSDGSAQLAWRDPRDFAVRRRIAVQDGTRPVTLLNELEYARGRVFANVWLSDRIAVIDPASGAVTHWLDLSALKSRFAKPHGWREGDHVLNGIAWDAASDRFYVTGKCWPKLFELEVEALR